MKPSKETLKFIELSTQAAKEAVKKHHKAGRPVPIMKNGKVEWV